MRQWKIMLSVDWKDWVTLWTVHKPVDQSAVVYSRAVNLSVVQYALSRPAAATCTLLRSNTHMIGTVYTLHIVIAGQIKQYRHRTEFSCKAADNSWTRMWSARRKCDDSAVWSTECVWRNHLPSIRPHSVGLERLLTAPARTCCRRIVRASANKKSWIYFQTQITYTSVCSVLIWVER